VEQPASIGIVYMFDDFRLDKSRRQLLRQDAVGKALLHTIGEIRELLQPAFSHSACNGIACSRRRRCQ